MLTISMSRVQQLFAVGAVAALALFGPPQIVVRAAQAGAAGAPAGAVLTIEGKHHDDFGSLRITGRAESVRAGKRITNPLTLTSTGKGTFAVTRQWESGTPWVLVFSAEQADHGNHAIAEALVKIDSRGAVVDIDHPRASIVAKGMAQRIGEKEVAAALATLAPR